MKKDLNGFIKNLFNKIRKKYHLYIKGLYKVKVYPNKIGTYIEAYIIYIVNINIITIIFIEVRKISIYYK